MVNEGILGGLKSALERGHSLEQAMISLFNAGYKRKEIEEAAVALLEAKANSQAQQSIKVAPKKGKDKSDKLKVQEIQIPVAPPSLRPELVQSPTLIQKPILMQRPVQPQIPLEIQRPIQPVQRVSSYEKKGVKEGSKERGIVIVLVLLLIFLIGLFAAIFLYRQQFIDFLNNLFS